MLLYKHSSIIYKNMYTYVWIYIYTSILFASSINLFTVIHSTNTISMVQILEKSYWQESHCTCPHKTYSFV